MKLIKCKNCNFEYKAHEEGNMLYICPNCFSCAGYICEYGFGPITPCKILLGDKEIGIIDGDTTYHLRSLMLGIDQDLEKDYKDLAVYKEAADIIASYLR